MPVQPQAFISRGKAVRDRLADRLLAAQVQAACRAQGLVEYAIIIAVVAVIALGTIQAFGGGVDALFQRLTARFAPLG
jgi:hypothetical protein